MGAMLDYSHVSGDFTYDGIVTTAILAQVGPNFDFMLPTHFGQEGNDDQAFWGFAVLSAAERNLAQPPSNIPSWLDLGVNIWRSVSSRWDAGHCGGGLFWQIFESNANGVHYKNSVSNGGLFQLSARLARATGNQTYIDWANKIWDWTAGVGMMDPQTFEVFDGADIKDNCTEINRLSFTYSTGIYLYGAAVMANVTGDKVWIDRAHTILEAARGFFFPENAENIMWEAACEGVDRCNTDMKSFKGYLSRFMWASTQMLPSLSTTVKTLLHTTAVAAAKSCTGGADGHTCGQKWYVGGFDNSVGLGQSMSALETIQGLLMDTAAVPLKGSEIRDVRGPPATNTDEQPAPTKRSDNAGGTAAVDGRMLALSIVATALFWMTA
jgi:mannan endo-1,6-alpha-mannosidase